MAIQVIGAGFLRTGTSSMKLALQELGYGECYHMKNLLINPYKLPYWDELEQKGTTDYDALFEGFQSIVDIPGYLYYKNLMEQYPDAKVVLTVRPFDKWYDSVMSTVYKAVFPNLGMKLKLISKAIVTPRVMKAMKCVMMVERTFFNGQFEGKFLDKAKAEEVYHAHIQAVKDYVPSDRLLVFEVKQGWGPLCEFLGKPVPEGAFPHANKRENFSEMMKHLLKGEMV